MFLVCVQSSLLYAHQALTVYLCVTSIDARILTIFPLLVCQLLDFEARSGEQVPLLLKMKRSQLALSKAVESGDTDLGECLLAPPVCQLDGVTLISCVPSLHGGDVPKERDEQGRLLHDTKESTSGFKPLQTGTVYYHFVVVSWQKAFTISPFSGLVVILVFCVMSIGGRNIVRHPNRPTVSLSLSLPICCCGPLLPRAALAGRGSNTAHVKSSCRFGFLFFCVGVVVKAATPLSAQP